jgi:formyl-CoA transferase/CoA:oxalate CoA-transferase
MKMLGIPVKLKKTPGKVHFPPPLLGQHSEEILLQLGYSAEKIAKMREDEVVKLR